MIRNRLHAKGVGDDILESLFAREKEEDEAQSDSAEEKAAMELARRKRLGPFCPNPKQRVSRRDRDLAVFARQGFDLEVASKVIDTPSRKELP